MTLQLPSSCREPYSREYWSHVKSKLQLVSKDPTLSNLLKTIKGIYKTSQCSEVSPLTDVSRLSRALSALTGNHEGLEKSIVKVICDLALQIEELFPGGMIAMLLSSTPSVLCFSNRQIHCLLAHMCLGTFRCCPEGKYHKEKHENGPFSFSCRMSFVSWYSKDSLPTTDIYIKALLNMFEYVSLNPSNDFQQQQIKFERKVLTTSTMMELTKCSSSLAQVTVHVHGRIGDIEEAEVDFANAWVGGGPGGTQEELLLGISPETLPISILNGDPLLDNECIVISGPKKYAEYQDYGLDAIYVGKNMQDWNWAERKIIAIDAVWFQEGTGETRVAQMKEDMLKREIRKCLIGFSVCKDCGVSTGHWGCGAFGGDKEIKAVLQLLGSSIAGVRHLDFFTFGDKTFADEFSQMLQDLCEHDIRVKDLWEILLKESRSMKKPQTFKEKYDPDPFLFKNIISALNSA